MDCYIQTIMDKYNLKVNEIFYLDGEDCIINKEGTIINIAYNKPITVHKYADLLKDLIVPIKDKLQNGTTYYCITPTGKIQEECWNYMSISSLGNYMLDNVYLTKEEALKELDSKQMFFESLKDSIKKRNKHGNKTN